MTAGKWKSSFRYCNETQLALRVCKVESQHYKYGVSWFVSVCVEINTVVENTVTDVWF